MRVWAESSIQHTLDLVQSSGRAIVPCDSPRGAKLFRQALYGHGRRHPGVAFTARVDGMNLIVTRRIERRPEARPWPGPTGFGLEE